jgi:glutamate carboxypeptidase
VDFRVASEAEANKLVKSVMSIKPNNPSVKLEISGGLNRPPMQKTYETERILEVAKTIGLEFGTTIEDCSVGGGSDGNFCAAVGIPVLDGLGAVGNGAHAENEFVDLNQMPLRAAIFERLLEEL